MRNAKQQLMNQDKQRAKGCIAQYAIVWWTWELTYNYVTYELPRPVRRRFPLAASFRSATSHTYLKQSTRNPLRLKHHLLQASAFAMVANHTMIVYYLQ